MKILLAILTAPIYLDIMCHMVKFSFRLFCYGPSLARNYPNYRSLFEIFTRLWHRLNRCRERHKRRNSMKNVTIYTDGGVCLANPVNANSLAPCGATARMAGTRRLNGEPI